MILNGEDYQEVQEEDLEECVGEFFLKPVNSRWLYLEGICTLYNWFPVATVFLR